MLETNEELTQIRSFIDEHPEGQNIKAVSASLQMNRNTVARHLETLHLLGSVEMHQAGISRIFYPSRRIPLSSIRSLIDEPYISVDTTGIVLEANEQFYTLVGIPPDEIMGKKIYTPPLTTVFSRESIRDIRGILDGRGAVKDLTCTLRTVGGFFTIKTIRMVTDDGTLGSCLILRTMGSMASLSGRALQYEPGGEYYTDQEEMTLTLSPDLVIILANDPYCHLVKRAPSEIIGESYAPLVPIEDWNQLQSTLASLKPDEPRAVVEHRVIMPDGTIKWQEWAFRAMYDAGGLLQKFQAVGHDITRLKRVEQKLSTYQQSLDEIIQHRTEELREINQQLYLEIQNMERVKKQLQMVQFSIDKANDPIIWIDEDTQIIYANENAIHTLGYTRDEILTLKIEEIVPDYQLERYTSLSDQVRDKGSFIIGSQMKKKNGQIIAAEISINYNRYKNKGYYNVILRDITEWKAAEESRRRLVAIIEANPYLVAITNPARRFIYMNQAGRTLLGLGDAKDLSGFTMTEFYPAPENEQVLSTGIPHAIRNGMWRSESRLKSRAGTEIPVEVILIAHTSPDGSVSEFSTIALDITERKRAEAAIHESEKKYRVLFESSLDAILLTNHEMQILDVNEAACTMFGFEKPVITGIPLQEIIPSVSEGILPHLFTRDQKESGIFVEVEGRRKGGEMFPAELSSRPVSIGGQPRLITFIHDITDRRIAEKTLQAAAFYARSLVEVNVDPFFTLAPDGVITDVNRATETLTGMTRDTLIGMRIYDLVDDKQAAERSVAQVLSGGVITDLHLLIKTPAGRTIPVLINATARADESGGIQEIFLMARSGPGIANTR